MDHSFSFGLKTYRSYFQQATSKLCFSKGQSIALIGPNNSGKSSLIRAIYELRNHFSRVGSGAWSTQDNNTYTSANEQAAVGFFGVSDPLDLVPASLLSNDKRIEFEIETEHWCLLVCLFSDQLHFISQTIHVKKDRQLDFSVVTVEAIEIGKLLSQSLYIGPYRNITSQANQGVGNHYDLPIGESFIAQWRSLKTGANRMSKIAVINTQRHVANLLGYQSLEINASEDSKTLSLVFDNDLILSLGDVGAGIAQMIFSIVTVANRSPQLILIDEPELHLHPTMQARFVEALHAHAGYATVFATHSVGLARQTANSIFVISQNKATGKSSITPFESTKNSAQLLGELSYSQFSAIGGQFLLLVEGTTEVRTFRVLLRKLGIDADVLIVPLGGSSLIGPNRDSEMSEFQRIGAEVFVLIDSERTAEGDPLMADRESFRVTCEKLFRPERVLLTQRRATENYMSDRAIKVVKSDKYRALSEYEQLGAVDPVWAKNENWKIADAMNFDEIKHTDLGRFLLSLQTNVQRSKQAATS
jgi:ABC-type branched-subunit amino acid transport system ATPase component